MPSIAASYQSPRATVVVGDGFKFMREHENEFDVIITDSSDPVGELMFTKKGGVFKPQPRRWHAVNTFNRLTRHLNRANRAGLLTLREVVLRAYEEGIAGWRYPLHTRSGPISDLCGSAFWAIWMLNDTPRKGIHSPPLGHQHL
jgi:hypothetical protein